ncbi:pyridoxal phosphate-dependent enzyme [Thermacetogenium phaeum DSM 12270]|uniref:Pyridoxal phosphate homeostasis protein n=1 Tax=Thermacetogenium phaeum (strain ATCC BAA-254 / DSM 26808 / PB) TaxID=1089553 RepID=K4LTZ3_THEPS|nr:YggS family pyridoxal phosphate-dependent enzyme [Thermacetogenium phaeum]AFV11504.1 pyridoxal phosphate-dependent enzyme [Thermacetogenium phaeum DSM 12270]
MTGTLKERIAKVHQRIVAACRRAGRDPSEVKVVAVTKMVAAEHLTDALNCGLTVFGENRVQEFLKKYEAIGKAAEWHLIGHLQSNKAKYLVGKVALIHSLDSLKLAKLLDKLSVAHGAPWRVLVQVNVSGEKTKFGLSPEEVPGFLDAVQDLPGIEICGLMTMAPYEEDPERTRPVFRSLRQLRDEMARSRHYLNLEHLSMGMTNDFEVAVEEGATMVRIGSALFSDYYN